jgi:hypothetical protein
LAATSDRNFSQLRKDLDGLREHEVRARLEKALYRDAEAEFVEKYLHEKEIGRLKAAQAEQTSIARSSKNAAWIAATFAIIAAIAAVVSAAVAIVALFNRGWSL